MTHKKKRVLVVDDEQAILRILSIKLRVSGYDVITAPSGEEALELVESARPDLMLLDIVMSGMDGFEVLQLLRSKSTLPVIVFSARLESGPKSMSLGANYFLPKPFDTDDLVRTIRKVLHQENS